MARKVERTRKIDLSINNLDITILSMLMKHKLVKVSYITNIKTVFKYYNLDKDSIETEKAARIAIIKELTDAILERPTASSNDLVDSLQLFGRYQDDSMELLNNYLQRIADNDSLPTDDDIIAVSKIVNNHITFYELPDQLKNLIQLSTDITIGNFADFDTAVTQLNSHMDDIKKILAKKKTSSIWETSDFSTSDIGSHSVIQDVITKGKVSKSKVKTGIQYINDALNGGWEPGRVYLALGVAKGWKSGFLFNSALWARKYNKFTLPQNKKPVALYLSMENSQEETIERMYSHLKDNSTSMYSQDQEVIDELRNAKIFNDGNESQDVVDLHIKYRPNKSVNANAVRDMIEEIEADGTKKVIFVVLDYLKRLSTNDGTVKELRLELADIANELTVLAKEKQVPILTAMQLNREAFRVVEESGNLMETYNNVKKLGSHHISESIDLIQNVDYAFLLTMSKELIPATCENTLPTTKHHIIFKKLASRFNTKGYDQFIHYFEDNNTMKLVEDLYHAVPQSLANTDNHMQNMVDQNINNANQGAIRKSTPSTQKAAPNFKSSNQPPMPNQDGDTFKLTSKG